MRISEKQKLVELVVEDIYQAYPELVGRFGESGRIRTLEDNHHHLDHLDTAFQMGNSTFFLDYTNWLNSVLTSRGVGTQLIIDNYERLLKWMEEVSFEQSEEREAYQEYLRAGIKELDSRS
ncbi:hypothetical protein [Thalassobacillus devorans]|uniref:hypothetical protein n=1 Tax=Thalassobacillus devorans TaxID=279813 RepID=UPI00048E6D60|nr:hypothetical protein [Thalassobacillus devorans]